MFSYRSLRLYWPPRGSHVEQRDRLGRFLHPKVFYSFAPIDSRFRVQYQSPRVSIDVTAELLGEGRRFGLFTQILILLGPCDTEGGSERDLPSVV